MKALLGVVITVPDLHHIAKKGHLVLKNEIKEGFSHINQHLFLWIEKEVTTYCIVLHDTHTVTCC